jgi:hypothetical protein
MKPTNKTEHDGIYNTNEREIYIALSSRRTKFTVKGVEFTENLIEGTVKQREKLCKLRAKFLNRILLN